MTRKRLDNMFSPIVIEHMTNPRNWGIMNQSDGYARITGPCGDTMEISLRVIDNRIAKCTYDTDGCGATVSCGSIVTELAIGKPIVQAKQINQKTILVYCCGLPEANEHCALLAANTLQEAIQDYERTRNAPWKRLYRVK
jgi:nitrogen fixation NifU-like protein